jgi:hypothetical protein
MNSEKVGGILGAIVAAAVLAMAIAYGPLGQAGKSPKPAQKCHSKPMTLIREFCRDLRWSRSYLYHR